MRLSAEPSLGVVIALIAFYQLWRALFVLTILHAHAKCRNFGVVRFCFYLEAISLCHLAEDARIMMYAMLLYASAAAELLQQIAQA
jgi:hypothetical protein